MTLQTNAHPRLKPEFENGARRCDIEAVIELVLDVLGKNIAPVAAFVSLAQAIGYTDANEAQYSRVLKQMADQGKLYRTTHAGKYFYGVPGDDIVHLEDLIND